MHRGFLAAAAAACLASMTALAADSRLEPALTWNAPFGGTAPDAPALGLRLRLADAALKTAGADLVQLDLDAGGAVMRIAGRPLLRTTHARAHETDDLDAPPRTAPWYARPWVLWTAGGVAAMVALAGGGSDQDIRRNCTGDCEDDEGVTGVGDDGAVCTGDQCLLCSDGSLQSECPEFTARQHAVLPDADIAHDQWRDAGTGRMGDLIAR